VPHSTTIVQIWEIDRPGRGCVTINSRTSAAPSTPVTSPDPIRYVACAVAVYILAAQLAMGELHGAHVVGVASLIMLVCGHLVVGVGASVVESAVWPAVVPPCNLTGLWRWNHDTSLGIGIAMTGPNSFNVTLSPPKDWQTASGRMSTVRPRPLRPLTPSRPEPPPPPATQAPCNISLPDTPIGGRWHMCFERSLGQVCSRVPQTHNPPSFFKHTPTCMH
jgi:hypothetical protein